MTKPELQANEGAMRAAEALNDNLLDNCTDQDVAQIIETTCHLKELEAVARTARDYVNDFKPVNCESVELRRALQNLDAAKEGK